MPSTANLFSASAAALLAGETSGMALDFVTAAPSLYVKASTTVDAYYGTPFSNDGGLVSFSRSLSSASPGTVVDVDGKVKWAAHNLLTDSEQFDAASWNNRLYGNWPAATATGNSTVAPNGTKTADTLVFTSSISNRLQRVQNIIAGATYTFEVFVLAASGNDYKNGLELRIATGNSNALVNEAAARSVFTSTISTTEWKKYSLSYTVPASGVNELVVGITGRNDSINPTATIYAWGAHLYRSDLGGMQANSTPYPFYNSTTPKNLLGYTEAFETPAASGGWTRNSILSITANSIAAPNGLVTADTVAVASANAAHGVYQTVTVGVGMSMSVYAKANDASFIGLTNSSLGTSLTNGAVFNLSTGAVSWSANCTATITPVGSGWYRCSCANFTASNIYFIISVQETATYPWEPYAGTGKSVYLWGAQLSDGASLDPYIANHFPAPTAAAYGGPRIDYDPVNIGTPRGLLVEEGRVNSLTYSDDFRDTAAVGSTRPWVRIETVVTPNVVASPDGAVTADKIDENTVNAEHSVYQGVTLTAAAYTCSVYLKAAERTSVRVSLATASLALGASVIADLSAGTNAPVVNYGGHTGGSATIQPLNNGWYRVTLSITGTAATYYMAIALVSGGLTTYAGTTGYGAYAYGAQLEAGAFATSYIPTAATTAERKADVVQMGVSAMPYSASAGTIYAEGYGPVVGNRWLYSFDIGTALSGANYIQCSFNTSQHFRVVSGNNPSADLDAGTCVANTNAKICGAYAANDFAVSLNGSAIDANSSSSSGATPVGITRIVFGTAYDLSNSNYISGYIRRFFYLPRRLTNTELQSKTL